jgi:hypothetical protein
MATAGGIKTCTRCGESKLITEFHFLNGNDTGVQERRRRSDCKECHQATMREYRKRRVAAEGEEYLASERERVRSYSLPDNPQAEQRRAVERARHRALRNLKDRHPGEYTELERAFLRAEGVV